MNLGDTFTIAGVHQPPRSLWRRVLIRLRLMTPPTDTPLRTFTVTATSRDLTLYEKGK